MKKNLVIDYLIENKELLLILSVAGISAYFFIFQGFPSDEYILYAIGIHNIIQNGITEIPNSFNGEMSIGYYLLIYNLMSFFKSNIELSRLMNSVGVISSIVLIFFIYNLFNSLFKNKKIALFICLNVMLAPTIWLHAHGGHPIILSTTFFIGSMYYFDKFALKNFNFIEGKTDCLLFVVLSLFAAMFRLDIVLAYGGYLGIMYYRRLSSIKNLNKLFILFGLVLIIILILRYLYLGYVINPTGGRFAYHLVDRLDSRYIFKNIFKNLVFWVVGTNVLIFFLSLSDIIQHGLKSRLVVLLLLWILPYCIFFPFSGMEVSRLTVPTVPIIVAVAIYFIVTNFRKFTTVALLSVLIIAQILPVPIYYLIDKYYPLKVKIEDRYVAKVPLGFLFQDHYYRQKLIDAKTLMAKRIASERENDILIIDFAADGMYYVYYILQERKILSSNLIKNGLFDCNDYNYDDLVIGKFVTEKNKYYILCISNNWQHRAPITQAIQRFNISKKNIHVGYCISEMQVKENKLCLNDQELANLIGLEKSLMETRRKVISK